MILYNEKFVNWIQYTYLAQFLCLFRILVIIDINQTVSNATTQYRARFTEFRFSAEYCGSDRPSPIHRHVIERKHERFAHRVLRIDQRAVIGECRHIPAISAQTINILQTRDTNCAVHSNPPTVRPLLAGSDRPDPLQRRQGPDVRPLPRRALLRRGDLRAADRRTHEICAPLGQRIDRHVSTHRQ